MDTGLVLAAIVTLFAVCIALRETLAHSRRVRALKTRIQPPPTDDDVWLVAGSYPLKDQDAIVTAADMAIAVRWSHVRARLNGMCYIEDPVEDTDALVDHVKEELLLTLTASQLKVALKVIRQQQTTDYVNGWLKRAH